MSAEYVPGDYWEGVLGGDFSAAGVAYPHLAVSLNRAMYRALAAQATRALAAAGAPAAPGSVLDVGCGTGIWLGFWRRRGVRDLTGIDLTEASISRLAERFPGVRLRRLDVADPAVRELGRFDAISAMSVLLHITDDARFRQAVANLAAMLRPGGVLLLTEPVVVHRWWGPPFGPGSNSVARPLQLWRELLGEHGLEIADLRPATVLLANPIDTRTRTGYRALTRYWDLLSRGVGRRERLGALAGAALGALDAPLRRLLPGGPSAKVLAVRRRG